MKNLREFLESFQPGETKYIPTTPEDYPRLLKQIHTRASEIKYMGFNVSLGTLVLSNPIGQVSYLAVITSKAK